MLCNILVHSQNTSASLDKIFFNAEKLRFDDITTAEIENFQFISPTIDPDRMQSFQIIPSHFTPNKRAKSVKKISNYIKYGLTGEKNLFSYDLFDHEGKKYFTNERGYINIHYYYDGNQRLKEKIRVVKNDTVFHHKYVYNEKNQLLASSEISVEYDNQHRPIHYRNIKFPNSPYITVLTYKKNKVRIEEKEGDKILGLKEFTFSENNNLIKETYGNRTVFNSYNDKNQKIKSIAFANKNMYSVEDFEFNEMGDIKIHRLRSTLDIKNGTKAENRSQYKYDQWGNKIYMLSEGEINAITTENFYEIEYY